MGAYKVALNVELSVNDLLYVSNYTLKSKTMTRMRFIYIFFNLSIFIQDNSTQHSQRLELKLRPDAFLHDRLQA